MRTGCPFQGNFVEVHHPRSYPHFWSMRTHPKQIATVGTGCHSAYTAAQDFVLTERSRPIGHKGCVKVSRPEGGRSNWHMSTVVPTGTKLSTGLSSPC